MPGGTALLPGFGEDEEVPKSLGPLPGMGIALEEPPCHWDPPEHQELAPHAWGPPALALRSGSSSCASGRDGVPKGTAPATTISRARSAGAGRRVLSPAHGGAAAPQGAVSRGQGRGGTRGWLWGGRKKGKREPQPRPLAAAHVTPKPRKASAPSHPQNHSPGVWGLCRGRGGGFVPAESPRWARSGSLCTRGSADISSLGRQRRDLGILSDFWRRGGRLCQDCWQRDADLEAGTFGSGNYEDAARKGDF